MENILLNPITIKRIELACGCGVEEFLADPSKFRDKFQEPNYEWMCTVSKKEAQSSLKRMLSWAKSDKRLSGGGSLGEWIYQRPFFQLQHIEPIPVPDILESKTSNAVQRNWRVPSEFPCCPQEYADQPIKVYAENLKAGAVFCQNISYSSLVSKCAISDHHQSLYVMSESNGKENAVKPWALAQITYENGLFVHTNLGSFFKQDGAEKQFCLAQGHEWTGGDSIDDYC